MKKYIVALVVLGSVCAYAESNPFDLEENLQKIDKDQDVLLSALKEIGDKQEQASTPELPSPIELENVKKSSAKQTVVNSENKIDTEEDNKLEEVRFQKIEAERLAQEEKKARAAQIKLEAEKREIAAYEAKKQKEDERVSLAKIAEKKRIKDEAEKLKHAIADIDIEREKREEKIVADREYLEAIQEVDREN